MVDAITAPRHRDPAGSSSVPTIRIR